MWSNYRCFGENCPLAHVRTTVQVRKNSWICLRCIFLQDSDTQRARILRSQQSTRLATKLPEVICEDPSLSFPDIGIAPKSAGVDPRIHPALFSEFPRSSCHMDLYQWIYILLVFSACAIPLQLHRWNVYAIPSHFLHFFVRPEFGLHSLLSSRGF